MTTSKGEVLEWTNADGSAGIALLTPVPAVQAPERHRIADNPPVLVSPAEIRDRVQWRGRTEIRSCHLRDIVREIVEAAASRERPERAFWGTRRPKVVW